METSTFGQTSISRSITKSITRLAGGIVFVAIGVWLLRGGAAAKHGEITILYGWLSVLFFGLISILILTQLILGNNVPVKFSPRGLADERSFRGEIPWSEIDRVSLWYYKKKPSLIRVQLVAGVSNRLDLTLRGKIMLWMNRPSRRGGLYMSSDDLDISFPELLNLMRRYVSEFRPTALDLD